MIYGDELLEKLTALESAAWKGEAYRHMFGNNQAGKENTVGARWNPPEVPAIYTSLNPQIAESEGDYHMAMQPLRPKAERRIHRIQINLASVLDLQAWSLLEYLGIDRKQFASAEPARCKEIGGSVAHLGHDGLLVPSARSDGGNLVIFPDNKTAIYEFSPIDYAVVG